MSKSADFAKKFAKNNEIQSDPSLKYPSIPTNDHDKTPIDIDALIQFEPKSNKLRVDSSSSNTNDLTCLSMERHMILTSEPGNEILLHDHSTEQTNMSKGANFAINFANFAKNIEVQSNPRLECHSVPMNDHDKTPTNIDVWNQIEPKKNSKTDKKFQEKKLACFAKNIEMQNDWNLEPQPTPISDPDELPIENIVPNQSKPKTTK